MRLNNLIVCENASGIDMKNDESEGVVWFGTQVRNESNSTFLVSSVGSAVAVPAQEAPKAAWEMLVAYCKKGNLDPMRKLVEQPFVKGKLSINSCDGSGHTLLHLAASLGSIDIVRWLIQEQGANVMGFSSETLQFSSRAFPVSSEPNATRPKSSVPQLLQTSGWTPLHIAASRGFLDVTQYLVENHASLDILTKKNESVLLLALRHRRREIAQFLIQCNADYPCRDADGATLLHYAASRGFREILYILCHRKHDCFALDNQGRVPLHYGALHGHRDTCELLVNYMKTRYRESPTKLPSSYEYGRIRDNIGKTPENLAVQKGNSDLAKFLRTFRDNRFLRRYQLLTLSKVWYFQGAWALFLVVVHFFGYVYILQPTASSFESFVLSSLLFGCFALNMQTYLTDPGYARGIQQKIHMPKVQNPVQCVGCQIDRPLRSRHCIVCDECVVKFDHHCILVNNCIGGGNHHYFYSFVVVQLSYALFGCYLCCRSLWGMEANLEQDTRHIQMVVCAVAVMGTISAMLFFIPHTIVMFTNITLYERAHARRVHGAMGQYSKGFLHNILEFWHIRGPTLEDYASKIDYYLAQSDQSEMV